MINEERLLRALCAPHVSEKSSTTIGTHNTIVLKVLKDATKTTIKTAVHKLFGVEVNNVRTLVVKGKTKRQGKLIGYRSDWKKAYINLKVGHKLDFDCLAEISSRSKHNGHG